MHNVLAGSPTAPQSDNLSRTVAASFLGPKTLSDLPKPPISGMRRSTGGTPNFEQRELWLAQEDNGFGGGKQSAYSR